MRSTLIGLFLLSCSSGTSPRYFASGPAFAVPTTLGEGSGEPKSAASASPPLAKLPEEPQPPKGSLPDPEPLRQAEQWEYELEWDAGALKVVSASPRKFPKPIVTARRMGRFAVELWIGAELVERVRFDFPMLAIEEPDRGKSARPAPPSLEKGIHARQRVLVPAAARARRAIIVDRATSKTTELSWPPEAVAAK